MAYTYFPPEFMTPMESLNGEIYDSEGCLWGTAPPGVASAVKWIEITHADLSGVPRMCKQSVLRLSIAGPGPKLGLDSNVLAHLQ